MADLGLVGLGRVGWLLGLLKTLGTHQGTENASARAWPTVDRPHGDSSVIIRHPVSRWLPSPRPAGAKEGVEGVEGVAVAQPPLATQMDQSQPVCWGITIPGFLSPTGVRPWRRATRGDLEW